MSFNEENGSRVEIEADESSVAPLYVQTVEILEGGAVGFRYRTKALQRRYVLI